MEKKRGKMNRARSWKEQAWSRHVINREELN